MYDVFSRKLLSPQLCDSLYETGLVSVRFRLASLVDDNAVVVLVTDNPGVVQQEVEALFQAWLLQDVSKHNYCATQP